VACNWHAEMSPEDGTLRAPAKGCQTHSFTNSERRLHRSEPNVPWRPKLREHLEQSWGSQGNYCATCEQSFQTNVSVCPNDGTVFAEVRRVESLLFNRYQVLAVVGTGSMGTVYKGKQQPLDRLVAVKFLKQQNPEHDEIFRQEARLASLLDHPNIIHVYDFGMAKNGQPFMIMDFVDGGDLDALLKRTTLTIGEAMHIFRQVCQGMAHAHAKGIVHCDIKPSNILLSNIESSHPTVYLTDFGIAKSMVNTHALNGRKKYALPISLSGSQQLSVGVPLSASQQMIPRVPLSTSQQMTARIPQRYEYELSASQQMSARAPFNASHTTKTGLLETGCPYYMSPEQALGDELDARSDIYALGCVMYEALTGMVPLAGDTPFDTLRMHVEVRPMGLRERCPARHIPEALEQIVMKALAKDPNKRFQDMTELEAALDNVSKTLHQKEQARMKFSTTTAGVASYSHANVKQDAESQRGNSRHHQALRKLNAILMFAASLTLLGGLAAFCFTELCPKVAPAKSQADGTLDDLIRKVAVATDRTKWQRSAAVHKTAETDKKPPESDGDLIVMNAQQVIMRKGPYSELDLNQEIAGGARPKAIVLRHTSLTDRALVCLRGLPELQSISLSDASCSNAILEPLKDMPNLKTLNVVKGKLTDAIVEYLRPVHQLHDLDLSAQPLLTANILKQLPPSLTTLGLKYDMGISRGGFADLARYKQLKSLTVSDTKLADGDLRALRPLKNLEYLCISRTIITDDGVDQMLALPSLREVDISETMISRDGLLKLARATNLKKIRCTKSQVLKKEDFNAFRKATNEIVLVPEEPNRDDLYNIDDPDYTSSGSRLRDWQHLKGRHHRRRQRDEDSDDYED
jgi:serine/threonine protein kinase